MKIGLSPEERAVLQAVRDAGDEVRTAKAGVVHGLVRRQTDAAAAWNNLASVLLELNRPAEARDAATRAVALGGPTLNAARETLRQVEAGR